MASKWWEAAPVVDQQAPQQRGGGVFIPDQGAIDDARRADTSLGIQVQGEERAGRREVKDTADTAFANSAALRKEFGAIPAVKNFNEAVTALDTALQTKADGNGDATLLYQYSKLMDPMGSVREGDIEIAQSGASVVSGKLAAIKKEFNIGGGGSLPQSVRDGLRREMISRAISLRDAYNQERNRYRGMAADFGFDPDSVIGPHAAAPFRERWREYDQRNGGGQSGGGRVPGATPDNITFDMDTGTGAFGSQIQADRLNPQQQAALDAFLKANAGNPNFGPDQLSAFYQSIGLQGGAMPGDDRFYEAVRSGEAFATQPNYAEADAARRKWAEDQVRAQLGDDQIGGTVAFQNGILPWSDEIMGLRGGIASMLSGEGFTKGYQDERDIERAAVRMSEAEHGPIPKIVGSVMTPAGLLSKGNLARDAMAMGALYGAGEGEGLADTVGKTLTGGALGYGAGKAIDAAAPVIANSAVGQRVSQALSNRGQQARAKFAEAAERQDIDYMMADAPGGFGAKMATGISGMTLGGIPLKQAAQKILDKAGQAKERIAAKIGRVGDDVATGQGIARGVNAWESQTQRRASEFFDRIPIDKDTPVDLSNTRSALGDLNNPTASNEELSALLRDPKMVKYQQALESGNLSWADTKAFRSRIGEQAGRPAFQQDASKDSLDALYGALTRDIEAAANAHSPQAREAFLRANRYWRGRETRREDVLSQLVGKDRNMSAEATTQQIERWAKAKGGDFNKLARAVRSLPDDEANATRAYILDRLGATTRTKMDGTTEEAFSPSVFMQQWGKISPRAKAVLFQGDHRKALDDLETVFSGMRASNIFGNPSGTGYTTWGAANATLAGLNFPAFVMSAVGQVGAGALLASPRLAKWIVGMAKKPNPSAQLAHVNQLTAIARSEPVIANDIFTLQERLAAEFSRSPGSLAAQYTSDGRGEPPAQGERGNAP